MDREATGVSREAIVWPAIAGLVLIILNRHAFENFFFGEDFITRTLYLDADRNLIKAIFTPFGLGEVKFFRPMAVVWSMASQLVLPWDAWLHHLRNLVVSLANIVLMHRILLHVSGDPAVRLVALLFFSASAIHFTIIGLINCVDNAGTLLLILCMALFTLRAVRRGRISDCVLALAFYACVCLTRDYSLVAGVFIVTVCLAPGIVVAAPGASRRMLHGLIAGAVMVAAGYLAIRIAVAGWPQGGGANNGYGISLQLSQALERLTAFVGLIFNARMFERYRDSLGFGLFNRILPPAIAHSVPAAWAFFALCMALTIATLVAAMRGTRWVLLALLWPAALIAPPLLVANMQAYYVYEGAAFAAIALAVLLTRAGTMRRYLVPAWATTICLMAAMHALSGVRPADFWWGRHSAAVAALDRDVLSQHRGQPLSRLTLIAPDADTALFWRYLTEPPPFAQQALITELLQSNHKMNVPIEAMPSDAIAIALLPNRPDAPIYALTDASATSAGSGFRRIAPTLMPKIERFDHLPRHIWQTWIAGGELAWSIAAPPLAHDGTALRLDLRATGTKPGMAGVRLLPPPGSFTLDVLSTSATDVAGMMLFLTSAEGEVVGSWSADFRSAPPRTGWNSYRFTPGQDNDAGFRWQPPGKPGHAVALDIVFQIDGGHSATVYLDSVRRE